jgi:hypothetical protein
MDERHLLRTAGSVSIPSAVRSQPGRIDAEEVSSKTSEAADSAGDESGIVASSAASAPEAQTPRLSGGVTTVLQASRAELDRLLAETQSLHERSWQVIHNLLEESQLRASQSVAACLSGFEKELRDRVINEMSMMLESFDLEAGARLAARLDQALDTARERQRSIEQDVALAVAENRKRLDQMSSGVSNGLLQRKQSLLKDLQREAERQLGELAKKADQITNNIQRLGDSLGTELERRMAETVQGFQSRIEQVWQEVVGRAEHRIAETAHTCTAELAKQAREMVDREMSEFLSQALRRFDRSSDARSSNQNT